MEAIRSSETSVLIRATRRHLPEDDNHHSHRRGNLKSYIVVNSLVSASLYNLASPDFLPPPPSQLRTALLNGNSERKSCYHTQCAAGVPIAL
jgi:hypothetical protein